MACIFIDDGYVFKAKVVSPRPFPDVTIRYRPLLPQAAYEYRQKPRGTGQATLKALIDLLKAQLVSWDAVGPNGNVASITEDNLRRMPQPVLDAMEVFVCNYSSADCEEDAKNSDGVQG